MTGFNSKREATADKLQEPVNLLEARRIAAEYGTPDSQVDNGNLYFALSKCLEHIDAQSAQEPYVRYCPDCGSIGSVPATARDCCPDGQHARMVPENFAKSCRATFMRAIGEAHPPQREWVGLTDEEVHALWMMGEANISEEAHSVTAYEVEAKLKEKNT